MPVDSLQNMALRALAHRGRDVHDFGVVPVHLIESILPKITSPDQLKTLEQRSPQIVGHTRDVWLSMLKRDIPFWKERLPRDYESTIFARENALKWHKVYFKLKRDVEVEKERSKAILVQGLQQSAAARGPETMVRSREPLYLGSDAKKRVKRSYNDAKFALNKDMYSKSKGEGFFDKVKRNAVSKSVSKRTGSSRSMKPAIVREIKRAPMGMVEDIKESRDAIVRNVGLPSAAIQRTNQASEKRDEANRRAAEAAGVTKLTIDFLEDDDEDFDMSDPDSDEELFGVANPNRKRHAAPVSAPPPQRRQPPPAPARAAIPPPRKTLSPPMRTASPLVTQTTAAGRGPMQAPKPMMIKRSKPARSIFAKK